MTQIKPTPLSIEGSFEKVVNAKTAERRKEKRDMTAAWLKRTFLTMVVLVAVLLLNLLLWSLNVIPAGPSSIVSKVITCVVSFLAGRIFEKNKQTI